MFLLCLLLLVRFSCQAQSPTSIRTEINELMRLQEKSWNAGDIPGFMAYYWNSDSLQFIGGKGIAYGWQKTLDNYKQKYPDKTAMGILTFELLSCDVLSDKAVFVIGTWQLQLQDKKVGGYFSLLWKKIKGKWLICVDHTS